MNFHTDIALHSRSDFERECRTNVNAVELEFGLTRIDALNGAFKMFVYKEDRSVGINLARDGYWEYWVTAFFAKFVRPGWTVLDIGANYGYYTLLFSALIEESGVVYAFEPNPVMTQLIHASATENDSSNIIVVQKAVGDIDGDTMLYVPDGYYGDASIAYEPDGPSVVDVVPVSVMRLDSFVEKSQMIKIDAEGSEEQIIMGGREYIKEFSPVIVMEWYGRRIKNKTDIYNFFDDLGYKFYKINFHTILEGVTLDYLSSSPELDMLLLAK